MRKSILKLSILSIPLFISLNGCGDNTSDNTNTYDLRMVNKAVGISSLLKGSYSDGTKGSILLVKTDAGNDNINGILVNKIKSDTSITLDNGYTSQSTTIDFVDENGCIIAFYEDSTYCTLITEREILPIDAKIGTNSKGTSIYSCDDDTDRTVSWSLVDAGNSNANYIFKSVISGVAQSESISTITITPQNKIIHYKVYTDVIAKGVNATFEGDVN